MSTLAIHNARVIDPALGRDGIADVVIVDGRIARVGPNEGDAVIEADRIDATELPPVKVKGVAAEQKIYQINGLKRVGRVPNPMDWSGPTNA